MCSSLGPIEICCDAPPFPVVLTCARAGFQSPQDVRWCRVSHFLDGAIKPGGILDVQPWKWLFGKSRAQQILCSCGEPLPILREYLFLLAPGSEAEYLLGQCPRCRTIFWEEG
jgi:hypothetical protein